MGLSDPRVELVQEKSDKSRNIFNRHLQFPFHFVVRQIVLKMHSDNTQPGQPIIEVFLPTYRMEPDEDER
jgi:hypothetical protein